MGEIYQVAGHRVVTAKRSSFLRAEISLPARLNDPVLRCLVRLIIYIKPAQCLKTCEVRGRREVKERPKWVA